jgi:hypothetical protein
MSSPEFEHNKPFAGEIDWSPETAGLKDFPARTREVLQSMGYETIFLNGRHINDLLTGGGIQNISKIFAGQGFDLPNLRTTQSEIAISRTLFLPGSGSGTVLQEDKKLEEYRSDLANIDGLESIRVCRGNLADYVAIVCRLTEQRKNLKNLPYYIRTSTTDSEYAGDNNLALLFSGIIDKGGVDGRKPNLFARSIPRYAAKSDIRIAPIIVPE